MSAFTHTVSLFIAEHRAWAGLLLGLVAFGESMIIIGAFLPATVLLAVAGGFIAAGLLDATTVLVWAMAGAILGDAVSFAIGRRVGPKVLRHRWLQPHARTIARTRLLLRRFGPMTIFLGRFAGPLRALSPLMAGMLRMPSRPFHVANIVSGVVWVLAFVAPGYMATKGVAAFATIGWDVLGPIGLAASVAIALGVAIAWGWKRSGAHLDLKWAQLA